jgi:hypothetical protein
MILNMRILSIFAGLNWRKVAYICTLAAMRRKRRRETDREIEKKSKFSFFCENELIFAYLCPRNF